MPTFLDDDDNLLLDDANTQVENRCWKCRGTGLLQDNPVDWLHANHHLTLTLDEYQLEDAPLLNDDRIGHLSVKNFHCHAYNQQDNNTHAFRTLCIVSVICFLFMILEIVGGHIAGSLAVMTDAAHLFSDIIGFLVSIISIWISKRARTRKMTFGFYRVEVMGAFISVLIVWLLAGIFCVIAIGRIIRRDLDIEVNTMLIVASFGVVINILMGALLHGLCIGGSAHNHSHGGGLFSHNHSHSHGDNINIRAAAAHVIGDLLQSLGVLLAAIVIKVYPQAAIADPICTVLFSVIIVVVTFKVARDSILVLIEGTNIDTASIADELRTVTGVVQVHSLHVWCLAPGKEAVAVHLAVDETNDRDVILNNATNIVRRKMNAITCAIQIEPYDHEQMSICLDCQH